MKNKIVILLIGILWVLIPNVSFAAFPVKVNQVVAQQVSDEKEIKETAVPKENQLATPAKIKNNQTEDKKGNGFGIASLSCALVGLRVPFFGILAVIFGAIGMNKNRSLRGLAIAGFSLGVLETVISFLALLLIIAFF
jgi:hypothetical protein